MKLPDPSSAQADRVVAASLRLLERLGAAMRGRDRALIVEIVADLVELKAPVGEQWKQLAHLAANNGEISLSRAAIDLFLENCGSRPAALYQKAALLERTGALREAYDLLKALPENEPAPAANAYSRGTAALFLGETEEARRQLERATRLQPDSGAAWLSLAMSQDLAREPDLARRIVAAANSMHGAPVEQQAACWFAAGKAEAELARPAAAFAAIDRGAQLARKFARYDRAADLEDASASVQGFTAERIAALVQPAGAPGRTIFVMGLPRSGTTLVEQILASHSEVGDGGEIDRLPLLANEVRGRSPQAIEHYLRTHGPDRAAGLWNHWIDERFGARGRVVDKSLTSTRFLGLAACLLPDAPLIWMTRDPLDCAWSCFRTFFEARFPWSYDLADIAWHFRIEDRLREQWRALLGDRLLEVPYEGLVAHPQDWIGRILAHCGLGEEQQVFEPHLTRRTVTTASVTQVRQPISTGSIGSARPYQQPLAAFVEAYSG